MQFQVPIHIEPLEKGITYKDKILLTGSCFTEHIGERFDELKFSTLQNPHGILFDPFSVTNSIISYIRNQQYSKSDLFFMNELWQSWQHHSRFSNINAEECLLKINQSQENAHRFLKNADWLIITLGSAFSYRLVASNMPVANCHRAPAQDFKKDLMTIQEINTALDNCLHQLFQFNNSIRILLTISPVRHIRDGVIENNRSKARLIEVVHHLVNKFDKLYYFPAYELVIDVLRDYRFYDIDLVHPNYAATRYVMDQFLEYCIDENTQSIANEIQQIAIARKHRAFHPATNAHRKFMSSQSEKVKQLLERYPYLNLREELAYFSGKSEDSFLT